jgi:hypothetical protein
MQLYVESSCGEARRHLRLVELHVHYSILCCKQRTGQLTDRTRQRFELLRPVFHGDRHRGRRKNRRYPMYLPCVIKHNDVEHHGILLDLSAGGAFFTSTQPPPPPGALVLVKVGYPRRLEFLFTCSVLYIRHHDDDNVGFGCRFSAAPLEIRSPEPEAEPGAAPVVSPDQSRPPRQYAFDAEDWPLFPSDSSAFDSTDIPHMSPICP